MQEPELLHPGLTAGHHNNGITSARHTPSYYVKVENLAAALARWFRHLDEIVYQKAAVQNVLWHMSGLGLCSWEHLSDR